MSHRSEENPRPQVEDEQLRTPDPTTQSATALPATAPPVTVSLTEIEDARIERAAEPVSQGRLVWRRLLRHKPALVSAVVLVVIIIVAITSLGVGPLPGWWHYDYRTPYPLVDGGRPSWEHPFGMDDIGRDYFALVMRGTQVSLMIAFVVGIVGTVLGVLIGAVSGYFRGWVDAVLMRITDVFIVVPLLLIAAIVAQIAGKGGNPLVLGVFLGLVSWTGLARLVRAEVLSLREREFVAAARSMGARTSRVVLRHLIPNAIGIILVNSTLTIAGAVLLETSLSYLQFGVKQPESSLGLLISMYQNSFTTRPWLFWWPGLLILAIALAVNFLGDGLRDAFDPRQAKFRRRRRWPWSPGVESSGRERLEPLGSGLDAQPADITARKGAAQ